MRTININEIEFSVHCICWGWCEVEVRGIFKGIESSTYIGGCSYESDKDFIKNSPSYEDMKQEVYKEIITKLKGLYEAIK